MSRYGNIWFAIAFGISLVCATYVYFVLNRKPSAPIAPVVTSCNITKPGMRRIGDQFGLQFDVPAANFTIGKWMPDAPPIVLGFDVRGKNSTSLLTISFDPPENISVVDPASVFAEHAEKRNVFDEKGHVIGEDSWSYLYSGERSRRVQLRGGRAVAKYDFVNERDAESFDQIIGSACLLSVPTHEQ